jgi:hypothetical protein
LSLPSEKVILLASCDPGFDSAFSLGRAKEFDPLLPYTVVIRNDSPREIVAYTVVWSVAVRQVYIRNVFGSSMLQPGAGLTPGLTRVVALAPELATQGSKWSAKQAAVVKRLVQSFSNEACVTISLDAVLFADGTAVGPDTANSISRWKAWIQAEQDVFTKATESTPAELSATLQQLTEPGSAIARLRNTVVSHFSQLGVLADHSEDDRECLDLARAYFAAAIADELNDPGKQTIANLREVLRRNRYP